MYMCACATGAGSVITLTSGGSSGIRAVASLTEQAAGRVGLLKAGQQRRRAWSRRTGSENATASGLQAHRSHRRGSHSGAIQTFSFSFAPSTKATYEVGGQVGGQA